MSKLCCRKKSQQTQTQEQILSQVYEKASDSDPMPLILNYGTTRLGLSEDKHKEILHEKGYNVVYKKVKFEALVHFIKTCLTPFNFILVTLSGIIYGGGDPVGGSIILGMIVLSVLTGFIQERRSNNAVDKLQKMVSSKVNVYRLISKEDYDELNSEAPSTIVSVISEVILTHHEDGHMHVNISEDKAAGLQKKYSEVLKDLQWYKNHSCIQKAPADDESEENKVETLIWIEVEISSDQLVEGDLVLLCAGDLIPGDVRLLTSKDLFVSQAAMTGESLPIEKISTKLVNKKEVNDGKKSNLFDLPNICLMGTSVVSGTATALVLKTGRNTYFGSIARTVEGSHKQTSFDKGINRFIFMMICFMVILCVVTLLIHGLYHDNWKDSIQFSLAIAVGLTPEMLPMIITATLAKGALLMAKSKVIVKRLKAIQNFGAMNILCTDKTGTLTQDQVVLEHYVDLLGQASQNVLEYAYYNSYHQTGLKNLLDKAILKRAEQFKFSNTKFKIDEIPFDFERRRMSVIIADQESDASNHLLICKGAIEEVLGISKHVLINANQLDLFNDPQQVDLIQNQSIEEVINNAQSFEILTNVNNVNILVTDGNESHTFDDQNFDTEEIDENADMKNIYADVKVGEELERQISKTKTMERKLTVDRKLTLSKTLSNFDYQSTNMFQKPLTDEARKKIIGIAHKLNEAGLRVICVATKEFTDHGPEYSVKDECDLAVVGFIAFLDPPKPSTAETLVALHDTGVSVKVLTGDNDLVATAVCKQVGINTDFILTGTMIAELSDEKLLEAANKAHVFCKLTPSQKQRIVALLQSAGNVVGFLGDGINDSPAIRAADVGISVDNAVDIAKESADIILLEKSLLVLANGVKVGRTVFGNIIKYIKMAASSNFGNVFSVTGASFLLPFIPMQPVQILIQNLLYDFSQIGIPFDHVDKEFVSQPRKWEIGDIIKFMVFLGPTSSIFDYCTFALMWYYFEANSPEKQVLFQTGWFVEALITQCLIVHIIRTCRIPIFQSRPSWILALFTFLAIAGSIVIIYTPLAPYIPFESLPGIYFPFLIAINAGYIILAQLTKALYYRLFGIM